MEFAGFVITPTDIQPNDKHIRTIRDFPTSQIITDIGSWFGLINQVSYCDSLRNDMALFREHLKPSSTFYWDDQLQQVFEQSKAAILDKITEGVRIFDSKRVTCLATDWSEKGIGFWLLRKYCTSEVITPVCCSTGWKIVFAGSSFTHPAESRYAPIEGEALAVVYGLESARHFVLGCDNLVVATDHKPLLGGLNNQHLSDIKNERLLSLKEKTLPYRFSIFHIPGQKQKASDANWRKPTGDAEKLPLDSDFEKSDSIACIEPRLRLPEATMTWELDTSADMEEKFAFAAATNLGDIRAVTWAEVREHSLRDENLQNLQKKIADGFQGITSRFDFAPGLRELFQFKDGLSTVDGVILYNNGTVIPSPLRALILDTLHSAHQGVSCMTSRAESSVFWPCITPAIANLIARCRSCNDRAPSQPHGPPLAAQEPVQPF